MNRICNILKPIEEDAPEDESLQAALMAQIRKSEYKGLHAKDRAGQKSIQHSRPDRAEQESDSRLTRLILDLKAEIVILLKAMVNHCISVESGPTSNKQKVQTAVVKQNGMFDGVAKKKSQSRRAAHHDSLIDPPWAPH